MARFFLLLLFVEASLFSLLARTTCLLAALTLTAHAQTTPATLLTDARQLFKPINTASLTQSQDTPARIDLGRRLFFENRVSMDGNISCGHCHLEEKQGSDGLAKAIGVFGKENPRNAPTIYNAGLNFKQHWRGDRATLEEQAEKSLLGPTSFGNADQPSAMNKLKAIPGYQAAFQAAFPTDQDPIQSKNWGLAVAAFERTLVTPAKFDAYLTGSLGNLSPDEENGLIKFINLGCANCHNGAGIGGAGFQKFGVYEDYWKETGVSAPDKGRADVTKNDEDLYVFKTPSLRNVVMTAPYFHDGAVSDLSRAIHIMGKTQLNKDLSQGDVQDIIAFLKTLTGKTPAGYSPPEPFPDVHEKK